MGLMTSHQITRYYDIYRDTEVTFSKEFIRALNLDPRQVYIKCAGAQWPCIINSTSLQSARIIIGTKGGAFAQISKENTHIIMKTDNRKLFEFSLQTFSENDFIFNDISLDLHSDEDKVKDNVMTEYEKKFCSRNQVIYMVNTKKR